MSFINIRIERETATSLKNLKITKLETYNEIINRLLEEHDRNIEEDNDVTK